MKRGLVTRGFDLWRKCNWGLSAEGFQMNFNTPNPTLKANWMKRGLVTRGFDLWRKCNWGLSAEGFQMNLTVVGILSALVKATF